MAVGISKLQQRQEITRKY